MRNHDEQRVALECLKLAALDTGDVVELAEEYYTFVTGGDSDDAKARLAAVREALT